MGEHITIQASSVTELRAQLEELGEPSLRDFNARLVPTESADTLLGIRKRRHYRQCQRTQPEGVAHRYPSQILLHCFKQQSCA